MSKFGIDLSKFKHVKSDDKSTTLKHYEGHEITLAHKALSKANQEALKAMADKASNEETQRLSRGGSVKERDAMRGGGDATGNVGAGGKVGTIDAPTAAKGVDLANKVREAGAASPHGQVIRVPEKPKKYAEGGGVEGITNVDLSPKAIEKTAQQAEPAPFDPNVAYEELAKQFPNQPEEALLRTVKNQQRAFSEEQAAKEEAGRSRMMQADQTPEALREARNEDVIKQKQKLGVALSPAEQQAASAMPVAAAPQQPAVPPAQVPAAPTAPAAETPAAAAPTGYQRQLQGIEAQSKAMQDLGAAQLAIQDKAILDKDAAIQTFEAQTKELNTERQALMKDVQDGHVNPDQYWTGDPKTGAEAHSKLMAGIGMILAGFNPTTRPNAAIEFIQKQMDNNIIAQQKNLDSKNNLLAHNIRQFGNLKDATEMTKIMQADMVAHKLASAAASATTPLAKAAALDASGKLMAANEARFNELSVGRTVLALKGQAQQDPNRADAYFTALDTVDPTGKRSAEARQLFIPALGFVNTAEGAKGLREMGATAATVSQSIEQLKKIARSTGKSLSPNARAEADTLRSMLVGQLRVPITGPGAMSEGERELLERAIPDVTAIMSLDSNTLKRLDTIKNKVVGNYKNMAAVNGIDPKKIPDTTAPKIVHIKGVAYQEGPTGLQKIKP